MTHSFQLWSWNSPRPHLKPERGIPLFSCYSYTLFIRWATSYNETSHHLSALLSVRAGGHRHNHYLTTTFLQGIAKLSSSRVNCRSYKWEKSSYMYMQKKCYFFLGACMHGWFDLRCAQYWHFWVILNACAIQIVWTGSKHLRVLQSKMQEGQANSWWEEPQVNISPSSFFSSWCLLASSA